MENNGYSETGSLKISEEVMTTIAGMATNEIRGVAGLSMRPSPDLKGFLHPKKGVGKAIHLEMKDGEAVIDIFVNLYMGFKIPEVAEEIQEKVKTAVQNMTGITVNKVNIHVSGIVINKETDIHELT